MVRRILALALTSLLAVSSCLACGPLWQPQGTTYTPYPRDERTGAERAEDKSVALLEANGGASCGGVWVAEDSILTAYHCIKDAAVRPENGLLRALGLLDGGEGEEETPSPIGASVLYADRGGWFSSPRLRYEATVVRIDKDNDLALLRAIIYPPNHDVAKLRAKDLRDGDELDIVGSTIGLAFSYSKGYVSASKRVDGPNARTMLQVSGPVYFGNSGGGAFDEYGCLVGIADYMKSGTFTVVPALSFFVPFDTIRAFLLSSSH